MPVYGTLAETRKAQFQKQQLKHVHHFRGELGTRNSPLSLWLEGRDADENTEADAIFFPNDSIAQFQLNYVMVDSAGNPIDAESSIQLVEKNGSANVAINNDTGYPTIITQHSAGTGTEFADIASASSGEAIQLLASQDATSNTVYVHATLELLSFISTDLSYLKFQSN